MNYVVIRKVDKHTFKDGVYSSLKSAKFFIDSCKKHWPQKGSKYSIEKRSKVECPLCNEMVKELTAHKCCISCQAKYTYMGTV